MLNESRPDSFDKSGYDVMCLEIVRQDSIAPIAPRATINCHAVLPLMFLQDTCQLSNIQHASSSCAAVTHSILESKLPSIKVGLAALAGPMTLTFNLLRAMAMTYSPAKFKVNGQSVPKIEWKQTHGRMRLHNLPQ